MGLVRHYNPKNERAKKDYFRFLKEADRKSESTIDGVRKAISRYEAYTGLKDFATFNKEQAVAFKKHLATTKAERSGEPLAKATLHATVNSLKAFFKWLSCQPGFKSRIRITDIEYLNLSDKEVRAARQPALKTLSHTGANPQSGVFNAHGECRPAPRPGACGLHYRHRDARQRDCLASAEARRR